jgi:hypothetical protein
MELPADAVEAALGGWRRCATRACVSSGRAKYSGFCNRVAAVIERFLRGQPPARLRRRLEALAIIAYRCHHPRAGGCSTRGK